MLRLERDLGPPVIFPRTKRRRLKRRCLTGFQPYEGEPAGRKTVATPRNADLSVGMWACRAGKPDVDHVLLVVPGNNVITDMQRLENGMFSFRFYGEPGDSCVVQASTNLTHWTALATNQVSGLGYFEFTDATSPNHVQQFYRIAP